MPRVRGQAKQAAVQSRPRLFFAGQDVPSSVAFYCKGGRMKDEGKGGRARERPTPMSGDGKLPLAKQLLQQFVAADLQVPRYIRHDS